MTQPLQWAKPKWFDGNEIWISDKNLIRLKAKVLRRVQKYLADGKDPEILDLMQTLESFLKQRKLPHSIITDTETLLGLQGNELKQALRASIADYSRRFAKLEDAEVKVTLSEQKHLELSKKQDEEIELIKSREHEKLRLTFIQQVDNHALRNEYRRRYSGMAVRTLKALWNDGQNELEDVEREVIREQLREKLNIGN